MRVRARARRPHRRCSPSRYSAQARACSPFPSTGPSVAARLSARTRATATRPVRRHDSIEHPDLVVVLDETLLREPAVSEGTSAETPVLVSRSKDRMANVEMLGTVAAQLGEPPLATLQDATAEILGGKIPAAELRAAVTRGYRCGS